MFSLERAYGSLSVKFCLERGKETGTRYAHTQNFFYFLNPKLHIKIFFGNLPILLYSLNVYMGRKLDKSAYWWRNLEDTWFIMQDNVWYMIKGKPKRKPEIDKKNPSSNNPRYSKKNTKEDQYVYYSLLVLASILGISLAINLAYLISIIND